MQLLHLVGATTTRFYHDLSCTYHQSTVTPEGCTAYVLRVTPEGALWLTTPDSSTERPTDLAQVSKLADRIDLIVPFMFCPDGMAVWREMFEAVFKVPVVGPPLSATVAATSKWHTKALARVAGVRTADAVRVIAGDAVPAWSGPVIVKPDSEDNSIGLSLVETQDALPAAIDLALEHAGSALVEQYIAGREVRVGVLDIDDGPRVLPVLEYHVSDAHPIRRREDKVDVDTTGAVTRKSWEAPSLETSCPAPLSDDILQEVSAMALTMHAALDGRDYALFDMRIDAQGRAYLLEACSFWTFAPISIISRMLTVDGQDLTQVVDAVFRHAAARDTRLRPPQLLRLSS